MANRHYLRGSSKHFTPSVVISFDTETKQTEHDGYHSLTLRCWDAIVRYRGSAAKSRGNIKHHSGEHSLELVKVIEIEAETAAEVWVVAHNLGFDLTVTALPFIMVDRGWQVDNFFLGDESCWWVLKRARQKVIITDSWSWFRSSLEDVARDIKRRKVALPGNDDSLELWHARCSRDTSILDQAMSVVLDWWDENRLGRFGITGAGCGWAAMRKFIPVKKIVVGPIEHQTDFERRAIYGGLKDVYKVGEFTNHWTADYDFQAAYPTTAAALPLPHAQIGDFGAVEPDIALDRVIGRGAICQVTITTQRPCAPVRIGDEVFHPVGTFKTVLTSPEIAFAATVAESVIIGDGYTYRTGFGLSEWARWVIALQNRLNPETPPLIARMAKGWGRSVTGRFASRTSRLLYDRPATVPGWKLEHGKDLTTGESLSYISMNGVERVMIKDQDGDDCSPAVLAFIEGYTRSALRKMIYSRESSRILQVNTDGWLETRAVRNIGYQLDNVPHPYRVVRKALVAEVIVLGPNHLITSSERRLSGIPRTAERTTRNALTWHDWPGMSWQLEHSAIGEYRRPKRTVTLAEHYCRRWVIQEGQTIPITTDIDTEGNVAILPWSQTWGRRSTDTPDNYQIATLRPLLDDATGEGLFLPRDLPKQPGRRFLR